MAVDATEGVAARIASPVQPDRSGTAVPRAPRAPRAPVEPERAPGRRPFDSWSLSRRAEDEPPRVWRRFFRDVTRGVAAVVLLHIFVVQISVVRGHSMRPILHDGDRLVVDRLSYSFGAVERFDVVVMRNPTDETVDYVKRVIGLPGDRVRLADGHLFINGRPVEEEFDPIFDDASTREIVVPPDHFFVLGDNRPISCDSREFGLVHGDLLKGKVRMRFWPPQRFAVF